MTKISTKGFNAATCMGGRWNCVIPSYTRAISERFRNKGHLFTLLYFTTVAAAAATIGLLLLLLLLIIIIIICGLGLPLCVPHPCRCGSLVDAHGLHGFAVNEPLVDRPDTMLWTILSLGHLLLRAFRPWRNLKVCRGQTGSDQMDWRWSHGRQAKLWHGTSRSSAGGIGRRRGCWACSSSQDSQVRCTGKSLHFSAHCGGNTRPD